MPHGDHPVVAQRRLYNTGTEESVWNPVEHAERAHPMLWQTINSSRGPGIVSAPSSNGTTTDRTTKRYRYTIADMRGSEVKTPAEQILRIGHFIMESSTTAL